MKPFFILLIIVFSFSLKAFELQSGDIILISFNCYECRVIESETNSPFSHSGVVVKNEKGELMVAQSLTTVRLSSLQDFLMNFTLNIKVSMRKLSLQILLTRYEQSNASKKNPCQLSLFLLLC